MRPLFFRCLILNLCPEFFHIDAGTGFLWVELVVTEDEGVRVARQEVTDEVDEGCFLGFRPGVGWLATGIKTSFVADADGVLVMVLAVCSHHTLGATWLYAAIPADDIVITNAKSKPLSPVPLVNLSSRGGLVRTHGRTMNDDKRDYSHNVGVLRSYTTGNTKGGGDSSENRDDNLDNVLNSFLFHNIEPPLAPPSGGVWANGGRI